MFNAFRNNKNHNLEENIFYWAVLFPVMSPSFFVRSVFADPFPEKNTDPNPLTNQNRKIFFLLQDSIESQKKKLVKKVIIFSILGRLRIRIWIHIKMKRIRNTSENKTVLQYIYLINLVLC